MIKTLIFERFYLEHGQSKTLFNDHMNNQFRQVCSLRLREGRQTLKSIPKRKLEKQKLQSSV